VNYYRLTTEKLQALAANGDLSAKAALDRPRCPYGVRKSWGSESCEFREGHSGKCSPGVQS